MNKAQEVVGALIEFVDRERCPVCDGEVGNYHSDMTSFSYDNLQLCNDCGWSQILSTVSWTKGEE